MAVIVVAEARVKGDTDGCVHIFPASLPERVVDVLNPAAIEIVTHGDAEVEFLLRVALEDRLCDVLLMRAAASVVAERYQVNFLAGREDSAKVGLGLKVGVKRTKEEDKPKHLLPAPREPPPVS